MSVTFRGQRPGQRGHEPDVLDVDPDAGGPSRRPVVAGVAAGLWALLVGVALVTCLVMLTWSVSPNSQGESATAWRAAGMVWLGAHHVPLEIGGDPLTVLPLGALLLGLLLNRRGGRWAARLLPSPTPREAASIAAAATSVYGAGGMGLAWLSSSAGTGARLLSALIWTSAVALVGTTWGMAREAGLLGWARARVSDAVWRTAVGGLAVVVGLLAVGAALVTVSLARHVGEVAQALADLDAGPVGEFALTLLGVLSLPTLDVWAMAVVVGPGFGLGSASALSAFGGEVQAVPALPVLAAIPATVPEWGPLLMLAPVALGALAGRIRWGRDLPTVTGAAVAGAGLAGVVASLVAVLVLLASGSLGGDRLALVGPRLLPVAGAAAGLALLGFLGEAGFQSLRLSWELHLAEQRREREAENVPSDPADPADPDGPRSRDRDPGDRDRGDRGAGRGAGDGDPRDSASGDSASGHRRTGGTGRSPGVRSSRGLPKVGRPRFAAPPEVAPERVAGKTQPRPANARSAHLP